MYQVYYPSPRHFAFHELNIALLLSSFNIPLLPVSFQLLCTEQNIDVRLHFSSRVTDFAIGA
jgi:hypothetical protein